MGTWGIKLYDDDLSMDIKSEYEDRLHRGKIGEEITQELISENKELIDDVEEGPLFWLALADTQWELGRLENFVKEKAIKYIDSGIVLKRWKTNNPKEAIKREEILQELKNKLLTQQPKEKNISQYKEYKCKWKNGDVYAWEIKNSEENEGKYIVVIKVSEDIYWSCNTCPVVYVYNKIFWEIPKIEELQDTQYLPQFYSPNSTVYTEDKENPEYKALKMAEMKELMEFMINNPKESQATKYVPKCYPPKIRPEKEGYKNILYKCFIGIEDVKKNFINQFIYIGNIDKIQIPNNEINESKTNDKYLCLIEKFEEKELEFYKKWENINY